MNLNKLNIRTITLIISWMLLILVLSTDSYTPMVRAEDTAIRDAYIVGDPIYYPSLGDLWMSTWADDDRLYLTWGDGVGFGDGYPTGYPAYETLGQRIPPACGEFDHFCELFCNLNGCANGISYPAVPLTDTGVLAFDGPVPEFTDVIIQSIDVPDGEPFFRETEQGIGDVVGNNNKPSSLLFVDGRLYFAGHYPAGDPIMGYIAYSEDYGQTWISVEDSPWGESSNFRVLMFINMGQSYALNQDGFVYAFGIGSEANWRDGSVYLTRVPVQSVDNYTEYEYFVGFLDGQLQWSFDESEAGAVENLHSQLQGSAIYHEGTGRYLYMTASSVEPPGGAGALFEAPEPWGPWTRVTDLCFDFGCGSPDESEWIDGKYIPGLITKDAGSDYVYFTISGGDNHYQLQIGKLMLDVMQ